ncbi:MAG: TrmJ/YjtD family RNA methyltransferase [Candidatus Palauibacterales bacterium]|nr:TrmJ/YjtD family RNA methyltransferase [Candidatus Palauibacterales bacterium]
MTDSPNSIESSSTEPEAIDTEAGRAALARFVVVLYQPQDLVNIALVVRAMKNMGLTRLRLVSPAIFNAYRITGIAHDTHEIVDAAELYDEFDDAVAGVVRVVATTARRRASQQVWSEPDQAGPDLVTRSAGGDIALVFGREDKGLPNEILDRCHQAVCIPTNPEHPSLNLGQAAIIVFYEIRRAVRSSFHLEERDLSGKRRDQAPSATAAELEEFFGVWERAMNALGMFRGVQPITKMRSYRRILKRSDMDRRELRLLEATAWRIVHFATRIEARIRDQLGKEARRTSGDGPSSPK